MTEEEVAGVWLWASDWGGYDERVYGIGPTEASVQKLKHAETFQYGEVFFQAFGAVR